MNLQQKIENIIKRNPEADDNEIAVLLKQLLYEKDVHDFAKTDAKSIAELATETMDEITNEAESDIVIKTGFVALERFCNFYPGEFIVIGGRPAMGKTSFLLSLAQNVSETNPVLYITFEMSAQELSKRLLSAQAGVRIQKMKERDLQDCEKNQLFEKIKELANHQLFIHDSCSSQITALKTQCKKQVKENGIRVIIIDYLQLISHHNRRINRDSEIGYICRELKNLAKEHNVCVIVSSQLSRALETRGYSKKPQLSDLRESGAIEQDADKVLFIYRPEYYGISEDECGNSTQGIADILVEKNRTGPTGRFQLKFIREFALFQNISYDEPIPPSIMFPPKKNNNVEESDCGDFTFSSGRLKELEESETPF